MNQSDKGKSQDKVFQKHGLPQARATTHENRGDKISYERVSEMHARVGRIFRRKVVTKREAGNYADVKWQITEVVKDSRRQPFWRLNHGAVKNAPENRGGGEIEKCISHIPAARLEQVSL